jgi:hypothetical protein
MGSARKFAKKPTTPGLVKVPLAVLTVYISDLPAESLLAQTLDVQEKPAQFATYLVHPLCGLLAKPLRLTTVLEKRCCELCCHYRTSALTESVFSKF